MKRREFLTGTAAGAAAIAGLGGAAIGQGPAPGQGRAGAAPGRGRGGRGRGGPAPVGADKLARMSIMSLNYNSAGILKLPWTQNPGPLQTVSILDLPQYQMDSYGVPNLEFQHNHLTQGNTDPDPAFFREMRAKLDAAKVTATQVNIEIGTISGLTGEARQTWMTLGKKWVDAAPIIGVKRLMLNQGQLFPETKANVISVWKELQDYAKPKGIMISAETRGGFIRLPNAAPRGGNAGARAGAAPKAAPRIPRNDEERLQWTWKILEECIEATGGYSNLDFGGETRFKNQQELHDAIKGMLKTSSGNMHIKSSPAWDIGVAVRYAESIGYKGMYSIEVNPEPAIRIVYNTILAAL